MNQPSLFEPRTGAELRDASIKQVMENADNEWKLAAESAIRTLCMRNGIGGQFTTDDVHKILVASGARTHEPRVLGGIMRKMSNDGWIKSTGNFRKTSRSVAHCRPVMIWEITK